MKKYGSYLKKPFAYVFFLALMLISFTAFGATIRVPANYSTIQAGIDAATNDDIVLVANGTYTGAGNKNLDFKGKAITVRSENGPENTVIDCEGDGRGFFFHSNETQSSVLDGFTIINGRADLGGGIYCSSSPIIMNCRIIGNEAEKLGGGVYFKDGSAKMINCVIAGNTAAWGGAIYCFYSPTQITNCTTIGNTGGGAIYIASSCPNINPAINNCILWDEPSQFALANIECRPNINYCDIKSREHQGSTIIHSDPLFVDVSATCPAEWDLHLLPSSPCIDKGTSKGAPDHDIDGDSRPQGAGYDMGADEYVGDNGPPRPVAHFSASPTSGVAPLTVNFTDQSTGQITSWSWDFGDEATSTEQNPSHTYTDDGSYTVSLTVKGPGGSDAETKTQFISVVRITPPPQAAMPWMSLLLLEDASQVPQAKLSISYDPNPVPVYTGNYPCYSVTEWHYTAYVSETAGVGLTVDRWTRDAYDQNGDHIAQTEYSSSKFADLFDDCGPESANIAPNSKVCGTLCSHLGGSPSGSLVFTFYGTDTNGNSVSESARVNFSAAEAGPCPSAPTPTSPSGTITDTTPFFTWSSVSGADVYWLQVKNASTNQDVVYRTNLTSTSYQKTVAMSPGNYKWRVASYRSGCSEAWSSYKNFIVGDTTLPVPGTWSTSTGFGVLEFTVNSSSTGITRVAYRFSNFQCGRIIYNGGISFSAPTPWPITNRKFTISNTLSPTTEMTIGGTFEQSGTRASGTWELVSEGTPCSGTWNAVK